MRADEACPSYLSTFTTQTFDGITIAVRSVGHARDPATIAYLTKGLLVQAALVTGTVPREELDVVMLRDRR
ncbi:MAG: hypothetical protein QM831_36665 [Kofleriaceae bacterium]